jgi:predicted membrane protein
MSDLHRRPNAGRIFWGLVLILIGALVLFERFGLHDLGWILSNWWPAIFILIGISILIGNGFRRPVSGLLFILFGTFFLLRELDILDYDVWHYFWPAALVLLGLWIILKPAFRGRGGESIPAAQGHDLDLTAVFSGIKRRVESANFKGGEATAVFGGADVDFTGAGLDGGRATIEATAIFGGITIIVPRDWKVVMDGTPILGGFELKHRNPPDAEVKATLYVRGTAIFGGVTVKD